MRTIIYVDGFNLYYRALANTPYKWLDLKKLLSGLLKDENEIVAIKYFTATVSGRADPGQPRRQRIYLNALLTTPEISIHKGKFLVSKKWSRIAAPIEKAFRPVPDILSLIPEPELVRIIKTEEKGSDVNLASHLLNDAWDDNFDVAAVVSNDTDLLEPIRMVVREHDKPVGLICPTNKPAKSLCDVASFIRHITAARLNKAQFPDKIPATDIEKPEEW